MLIYNKLIYTVYTYTVTYKVSIEKYKIRGIRRISKRWVKRKRKKIGGRDKAERPYG